MGNKKILVLIFFLSFCISTLSGKPQHYMPLTVDITMTPNKEVYYPGDIIEVSFHAYFNDEIKEEGKEYLLLCPWKNGKKIFGREKNTKKFPKKHVEIGEVIESTMNDTVIYFRDEKDEYNCKFKIKIYKETHQILIDVGTLGLGKKIFGDGRVCKNYIIVKGQRINYYESKTYRIMNTIIFNKPQTSRTLKPPKPDNYVKSSTLSGKPQHYMPLTVDITMTPNKEVYYPGDIIEVSFHAYFNDEIKEKGKEYLLKHSYYKGRKLSAKMKGKRNKSIETEFAEVIETSYENTLVYFKNKDDEYRGSFKMKILTEVKNIVIGFKSFGLGEKYYDGKRMGGSLKIEGNKIYYYESKRYSKRNKMKIWPKKEWEVPPPNNYNQIENK